MKTKKMQVEVNGGEAFPVYEVYSAVEDGEASGNWPKIEVEVSTLKHWEEVFDEFTKVQQEIIDELNKQGHKEQVWYGHTPYSGFHVKVK
jgi:hypothetical protein